MKLEIQAARNAITSLASAFFEGDRKTLQSEFSIGGDLIDEGVESINRFLKGGHSIRLAPPPSDCEISVQEDGEEENEMVPIRIYTFRQGGWGYEMDVFSDGEKSDLTMRGALSPDFNANHQGIEFYLFEVM